MSIEKTDKLMLPLDLPEVLLKWYDVSARPLPWRKDGNPYHVWVSEIMLQQTRVEVVKSYYTRFLERIPTIEALAKADEQTLFKLWEGLGYYSRVRNLQKAAKKIVCEHNGQFPDIYDKIIQLPGIGPYTAGAIASICFGQPTPAVDGNVIRIISRITANYEPTDSPVLKKSITSSLSKMYPVNRCGDFTQALMELGAVLCIPNGMPKCHICPVSGSCKAYLQHVVMELPIKTPKNERKIQNITLFVFSYGDKIAIRRRNNQGLLAGLWEFPNVTGNLNDEQAVELAKTWNTDPISIQKSIHRTHIFTHIKWNMTCYYIGCSKQEPLFTWVSHESLTDIYPLPTAFRMFADEV